MTLIGGSLCSYMEHVLEGAPSIASAAGPPPRGARAALPWIRLSVHAARCCTHLCIVCSPLLLAHQHLPCLQMQYRTISTVLG